MESFDVHVSCIFLVLGSGGHVDVNLPRNVREAHSYGVMRFSTYQDFEFL